MACPSCGYPDLNRFADSCRYCNEHPEVRTDERSTFRRGRGSGKVPFGQPSKADILHSLALPTGPVVYVRGCTVPRKRYMPIMNPGDYYVGSTVRFETRYNDLYELVEDVKIAYPAPITMLKLLEQGVINLLTDLGVQLINKARAHPDKVSYVMLPDELIDLCRRFASDR